MPAREHNRVLGRGEAHDTLALGLICDVRCCVVYAVDVIQFEDRVVVLKREREVLMEGFFGFYG